MLADVPGEPLISAEAGIVAPCDPANPPIGVEPAQCEAERAATAAYLASHAEGMEWGRGLHSRAVQGKAWCERREPVAAEANRAR